MSERRTSIEDAAFHFQVRKNGEAVISYHGKPVSTLRGKDAAKFTSRISNLEGREAQLLMARVTGNFKRGNERESGYHKRRA